MLRVALAGVLLLAAHSIAFAGQKFFPDNAFGEIPEINSLRTAWYSKHLSALEEGPIFQTDSSATVYRFLWLRTFHRPMVFRLDVDANGAGTLTAKATNGQGGYEPGAITNRVSVEMTIAEVAAFENQVEGGGFWSSPSAVESQSLDGARWIFEASKLGKYHIVDRSSDDISVVQVPAMTLMRMSGLDLGEIY